MDRSIAIDIEHVSKLFYITQQGSSYRTLRELVQNIFSPYTSKKKRNKLWALDDISFQVKTQDRFAIIGLNGAGKSTLLKVLSRVLVPTSGRVRINGRVSSLLELGTGFHPDLSGRDNIYLNGSILGMSRKETRAVYEDILEFSEIEKFIDTPIKFYSSGMQARLGFAVAAHLNSEILIVDEVLSVGDFAFQQKCIKRMHEICRSGRTILFVSHNLDAVKSLCDRAILLSAGKMQRIGNVEDVSDEYARVNREQTNKTLMWSGSKGNDYFQIKKFSIENETRNVKIERHASLTLIIEYEVFENIHDLIIGVDIINSRDHPVAATYYPASQSTTPLISAPGVYLARLTLDFSLFTGGNYTVAFLATMKGAGYILHHDPALRLFVDDGMDLVTEQYHSKLPDGVTHPTAWKWVTDH